MWIIENVVWSLEQSEKLGQVWLKEWEQREELSYRIFFGVS